MRIHENVNSSRRLPPTGTSGFPNVNPLLDSNYLKLPYGPVAHANAIAILRRVFENLPTGSELARASSDLKLTLKAEFACSEPRFILLCDNYEIFRLEGGKVVRSRPPEIELAGAATQSIVKHVMDWQNIPAVLMFNPSDIAVFDHLSADKMAEKRKDLRTPKSKRFLTETIQSLLKTYGFENLEIFLTKQILGPEKRRQAQREFCYRQVLEGNAGLLMFESEDKNQAHDFIKNLLKGDQSLARGWAILEDPQDAYNILLQSPGRPVVSVQIGRRNTSGTYNPYCPILVAMGMKKIETLFKGTAIIGVFNEQEGFVVPDYARMARDVFKVTDLNFVVGGLNSYTFEIRFH